VWHPRLVHEEGFSVSSLPAFKQKAPKRTCRETTAPYPGFRIGLIHALCVISASLSEFGIILVKREKLRESVLLLVLSFVSGTCSKERAHGRNAGPHGGLGQQIGRAVSAVCQPCPLRMFICDGMAGCCSLTFHPRPSKIPPKPSNLPSKWQLVSLEPGTSI